MNSKKSKSIAVIIAHPDDETLWAGGTILSHPSNKWFIVCICRASDKDRSTKFYKTLKLLKSEGIMGDMDDGPTQDPLNEKELEEYILNLLPEKHFDLIITHDSKGEYTRHLRHEEVNKAVISLWHSGKITTDELWTFAYEDGNKAYFPQAIEKAPIFKALPEQIWLKKYAIITKTYGYDKDSWEAETTPVAEAFWQFKDSHQAKKSNLTKEKELNIFKTPDLERLKSMYYKSKAYVSDKINLERETSLLIESFRQFKDLDTTQKTLHYFESELKIFKTPSIEILKSLYYNNMGKVFNKQSWELEVNSLKETFLQFDNIQYARKTFIRFGKELKIFNRPSIDILKSAYNKSIGYVFNKGSWNFESPSISKTFRYLNKNHRTKKTLDKIGNELRIFNKPTIENLKLVYYKTSKFLDGSQQQNEQPSSI